MPIAGANLLPPSRASTCIETSLPLETGLEMKLGVEFRHRPVRNTSAYPQLPGES